jgi:hypothetical protein
MIGLRWGRFMWQAGREGGHEYMIAGLIIQLVVMLIPVVVFVVGVEVVLDRRSRKKLRKPSMEKMLRAPGESLRHKMEGLDEQLYTWVAVIMALAATSGIFANQGFAQTKDVAAALMHPGVILCLVVEVYVVYKLFGMMVKRRNYRLGLSGELAVGEELNQLMLNGCHVFHDFPGGEDWNIDHIIVAPGGVFAIETKSRSKRRALKDQPEHEVKFNGEILIFPDGWTAQPLAQAERNATQLAVFIRKSTGEESPVIPVVVLPGWYVTAKPNTPIKVLNPKMVRKLVVESRRVISAEQMQRICHQIEQKCRDVEF